jgi:hypothetical protein
VAVDALGLTIATAKGYILAGTCRAIDGDVITLVLGDGSKSVRCTAGDLLNFADLAIVLSVLYQAKDDQLSAVAALSPAANKLDYWTSATAKALTDLTAFARGLLDDADAATARTTLGLAALAVLSAVGTGEITANAVTNAKLAQMVQATIKGRASGAGTGDPSDLTAAQVATILSGQFAAPSHTHVGEDVSLSEATWSGVLAGSGVTNTQELANWIDANVHV